MAVWNLEVVRQTCAAYNLDFGGTFWHANSDFRQSPTQITALDWHTKGYKLVYTEGTAIRQGPEFMHSIQIVRHCAFVKVNEFLSHHATAYS